ncbi:hypothetical protein TorRG33x02_297270, partial [Trema orientale]
WNSRRCPHCLSLILSFNISEYIIRSLRDPPIWDSNLDDTRHSATPPDDHRTDHATTTPLMPDDDHHHTTAAAPLACLDHINHAVTSHIFANDQHHTATTIPPGYNDDQSIADVNATPGVSEDDHHMAAVAPASPGDDCHSTTPVVSTHLIPNDDHHHMVAAAPMSSSYSDSNTPVVAAPLISDKENHYTAAVVPPASSNYINHVDTFYVSLDDHRHTTIIASPGFVVTATAAATLGISEHDHHIAAITLPCPKDDCHNIDLAPPSEDEHHYKTYLNIIDPPIWDPNLDDTRRSTAPPKDHLTDHAATNPLMPDDDHHHTTVAAPSASLDYIGHAVTSHIFANHQHQTATTVPPSYNDDHSIADEDATLSVSEDDHYMAAVAPVSPGDDCHSTTLVVSTPLISDDDYHHMAAAAPLVSSYYIDHVATSHISVDDHSHTAITTELR